MLISRLILKNWRNFQAIDVTLGDRMFLIGPNACGKSNFLDVFRFLRDIAKQGGGLQQAVSERGGVSKIRCLYARRYPEIEIEVHLAERSGESPTWRYALGVKQKRGASNPLRLTYEKVWQGDQILLSRPTTEDHNDELRLAQTHLEQVNANTHFRGIAQFFESIFYLHLVPQLLRYPDAFSGSGLPDDPFGRSFLERLMRTPERTRRARLRKIEAALRAAVPQLRNLTDTKDSMGIPHLEAVYEHWRPNAGKQQEDQFSDGTLRLIGLLWSLLETDSLLLLEEPELSLNPEIVRQIPAVIHRVQGNRRRQVLMSTHSPELLNDYGIGGEEVLILQPSEEGTHVKVAADKQEILSLLQAGLSIAEAAMPYAKPVGIENLRSFR
ncbi:AAA family ATPase [Synechococcales cyanobacterium C]|uniref:AAA family ATPase n=2 Tax=Petrachloros TaxID=2918834 RepID=A0A8K1ZW59_9CYAN|nr:AAA family ATPase [Petrachloros mirabilis ULC683]